MIIGGVSHAHNMVQIARSHSMVVELSEIITARHATKSRGPNVSEGRNRVHIVTIYRTAIVIKKDAVPESEHRIIYFINGCVDFPDLLRELLFQGCESLEVAESGFLDGGRKHGSFLLLGALTFCLASFCLFSLCLILEDAAVRKDDSL